jgi:hypothetical protein
MQTVCHSIIGSLRSRMDSAGARMRRTVPTQE